MDADPVLTYLTNLWRELLRVERVGEEDDFFALGGNSLLALQMLMAVSVRFAMEADAPRFLAAPTIRVLSDMIAAERRVLLPSARG